MPDAPSDAPPHGDRPLTPERWRLARTAFDEAVGCAPGTRAAVLDAACAGDDALRAVVERMLAADADASVRLGPALAACAPVTDGPFPPPDAPDQGATSVAGRRVGAYRLVREVGRGGMGTVYLAVRDDVGRQVALKLVRGGLAAPERVTRFLVERRVLARLDHPHVARLLDAGVVDGGPDDGTPWFAMEYVDGAPLDRYADARRLSVPERLRLMEQACEAVAYAHRHLVVHRDLKPSNLLVTADGEVKLLDFGIAKLLEVDALDGGAAAGLTEAGVRLLTPEYAAPEQARGEPVTTATDVYALGVVLYELLAGTRPSDAPSGDVLAIALGFATASHPARRVARPSTAVGRLRAPAAGAASAEVAAGVAAARGTTPDRLRRQLSGDLDTITLKALDPDPERRYASAAELLEDLRRYRTGFPVRARPDTTAYRARAFVRRNRWGVVAAAGLVALLTGTAVVTTVQQARTARALAQATAEAAKARQVTRFITALLEDADPYGTGDRAGARVSGADRASGGLARIGAERLDRDLAGQPEVRTELLRTLAVVQRNLGHWDEAEVLLRRRLAALRQARGASGSDTALGGALHDLGTLQRMRSDYAGADTLLQQALAIRERRPGDHGADLAATQIELATLRRSQARFAEAERVLEPAIATLRPVGGPPLADALDQLIYIRAGLGDPDSATALARQDVAIRERWQGPDHPAVGLAYSRLANILNMQGRDADAEPAVRRALAIERAQLPAGHPEILRAESTLAWVLLHVRKLREAEQIERDVLAGWRRLPGNADRDIAGSLYTLACILNLRGALPEAARLLEEAAATSERALGPSHPEVLKTLELLAEIDVRLGRDTAALETMARLRLARREPAWDTTARAPDARQENAQLLDGLASLFRADDDCRHARPLARRALAVYGARHPGVPSSDARLAQLRAGVAACGPSHDAADRR